MKPMCLFVDQKFNNRKENISKTAPHTAYHLASQNDFSITNKKPNPYNQL